MWAVMIGSGCMMGFGLFVVAEFALVRNRRLWKRGIRDQGYITRWALQRIYNNLENYLALCQSAKMLILVLLGCSIGVYAVLTGAPSVLVDQWALCGLAIVSMVLLSLCHELAKAFAITRAEYCSKRVAIPLVLVGVVMLGVIRVIRQSARYLQRSE